MKSRVLKNTLNRPYAIEIDMEYVSVRSLARMIGAVTGVSDVRVRREWRGRLQP